jgi:hypothetical protein
MRLRRTGHRDDDDVEKISLEIESVQSAKAALQVN